MTFILTFLLPFEGLILQKEAASWQSTQVLLFGSLMFMFMHLISLHNFQIYTYNISFLNENIFHSENLESHDHLGLFFGLVCRERIPFTFCFIRLKVNYLCVEGRLACFIAT
ncbi:hypothetical protein O6H91_05G048400 [Diphasiastrum complanatum]|uniref:Uncharacterized protein n=1 Tax=Diphasiastrum complanatum TaxID=34168 RepID=A0ACC2DNT3_DIPCM|nr:hypothetical protein O6H91_05G048400 [Diphasiastrum complanatum]